MRPAAPPEIETWKGKLNFWRQNNFSAYRPLSLSVGWPYHLRVLIDHLNNHRSREREREIGEFKKPFLSLVLRSIKLIWIRFAQVIHVLP